MKIPIFSWIIILCLIVFGIQAQNVPVTTVGIKTNATTGTGATVIPITVKDFESIGAFTLTLRYRLSYATYVSATPHPSFPGMTVTQSSSGLFGKLQINLPQTPAGVTLPDETVLVNLTFTYISNNCALTWIFSGSGNVCQYKRYSNGTYSVITQDPKQNYYINGGFANRGAPVATIQNYNNPAPGALAIPITMTAFTAIGNNNLSIEYNQNCLTLTTVTKNTLLVGTFNFGTQIGPNGKMIVNISFVAGTTSTLTNGATAYTLYFTYSTETASCSELVFINTGSDCEYGNTNAEPFFDFPTSTYYNNGSIYTQYAPKVWLPVTHEAVPSNAISLPVSVTDFTNVKSFYLTFEYDDEIMTYSGFTPDPAFIAALGVTDSESGSKRKIVLTWTGESALTLPDGNLLASVNFNYLSGSTALSWIVNDWTSSRFNSANGNAMYDWPKSLYFQDGIVASHVAPVSVAGQQSAVSGQPVTVPVCVYDFSNIGLFGLTMDYDPAVLAYQGVTLVPSIAGTFLADTACKGRIMMDWSGTPTTLADSTHLINLNFIYNGGATTLAWYDSFDSCRYKETIGGASLYDSPESQYYINGYVGPDPLIANFNATGSGTGSDTIITLHDLSTGSPQTWKWSISPSTYYFVNGTKSTSQNPQIKFTEEGFYSVKLIVTKGTTSAIRIKNNSIYIGIPVSLSCPENMSVGACQSQETVNTAYTAWLASAVSNCACNCSLTHNSSGPPSACGDSKTVTFTLTSDCYSPLMCIKTFTVDEAPAVVFNCGTDITIPACSDQATIDAAFASFIGSTSASGGCNGVLANNAPVNAPPVCGGFTDVTWTYTSSCEVPYICTKRFTITPAPAVVFTCGTDVTIPACSDQATIDAAYASFIASTTVTGGCNGVFTNNAPENAPAACGGSVEVTWTFTNSCDGEYNCKKSFTVTDAPAVVFTCGEDVTIPACSDQATIDAAYASFIASTTVSGGCNGVLSNDAPENAPTACGGSIEVTWTFTSSCDGEYNCKKSFTVANAPAVIFTCGEDVTVPACSDQATIDAAYYTFMASTTVSGGCNGVLTNNAPVNAPPACGGFVDVTWEFTSSCDVLFTCTKTFTVAAAPVVFTCGDHVTVPACSEQATIDASYLSFIASTTASGGCNGDLTHNAPIEAPPACGGSVDITWTYTSNCDVPHTCTRTFTVAEPQDVILTCPQDYIFDLGHSQPEVDAAFTGWINSVIATGGCNTTLSNDGTIAPPATGGEVTVSFTYTSNDCILATETCSATFVVGPVFNLGGILKYYNENESPMGNIPVRLQKTSIPKVDITFNTLTDGSYSFGNIPAGDYTITPLISIPAEDMINATDAALVNLWGTADDPVEYAKFLAGDVVDNYWINSTDAMKVQRYFVFDEPFDKSEWSFWQEGYIVISNWVPLYKPYEFFLTISDEDIPNFNLLTMFTGDFNGSFEPGVKTANHTLIMNNSERRLAGSVKELDLPVRLMNASTIGAVSLVLNVPADLVEITDVAIKENGDNLLWSIKGNELRIGWNSLQPLWFEGGEDLLVLHIRITEEFSMGDEIRITLVDNPLNELADGNYKVIPDAVIDIDILEFSPFGTDEPATKYELKLESIPNPFIDHTTLVYSLPAEGRVTLHINEILGREVLVLVDEFKVRGEYIVKLDALPLQPGIYSATMVLKSDQGDLVRTIKLVHNW